MTNCMLVTRPSHDVLTNYLHYWSEDIINMARSKGMDVYDLDGTKANRKNFESYVKKHKPALTFINGHGSRQVITGENQEPIMDMRSTVETSVMYARSCDAAAELGNSLVSGATEAFIGYRRKFILSYSPSCVTKPLQDPIAKLFLEPSNLVVTTVLKNHTAREAHKRSVEAMYKNFRRMVSSQASDEERYAARWMWANLKSQVLLGNKAIKIQEA